MPPSSSPTRAKVIAAMALAALAAASLTMTAEPPGDPVLAGLGSLARRALLAPLQSLVLLGMVGGFALLAGTVVMAIRAYLDGVRVDWLALLTRRLWHTALGYCVLGLLALFVHTRNPQGPPVALSPGQTLVAPAPERQVAVRPVPMPPAPALPGTGTLLPLLLAGAVLLAGAAALAARLRRSGTLAVATVPEVPLAAARRRLELGDRVRDAIIGCYAEMCAVFRGRGPAQTRALTAREFAALLRARGAGEPEIQTLTAVFEKARYSDAPCDEGDRTRALEALAVIEAHYRVHPGGNSA